MIPTSIDAYLQRIRIPVRPALNYDGLSALITAHLQSVPFENLTVLLGENVDLNPDALFDKIVRQHRGGYCYEVNGLFAELLTSLGFDTRPLAARIWRRNPTNTPPETHVVNAVTIDTETYIVDVGFGGTTPRIPVPLRTGISRDQDGEILIEKDKTFGWMLSRIDENGKDPQFSVSGHVNFPMDRFLANHYMATHPLSHFTHDLRINRFTADGRISLAGNQLLTRQHDQTIKRIINQNTELRDVLKRYFDLDLGDIDHEKLISRLTR